MRFKDVFFVLVLFYGVLGTAYAAPLKYTHQGRLSDAGTQAPLSGSQSLKFSIYNALSGGSEVWTETHTVTFVDGYYSVVLGNTTTLDSAVLGSGSRWLEIKVGSTAAFSPRQEITSAPYAIRVPGGHVPSAQADAITANTAKTGISSGQASAISANTAKTSFPGFGTTSSTALRGDSLSGYATQNWVTDTALSGYATETWVIDTAISGSRTEDWVSIGYACPATQVPHSNYSASGSLRTFVGDQVTVTCDSEHLAIHGIGYPNAPSGTSTWSCSLTGDGPRIEGPPCRQVRLISFGGQYYTQPLMSEGFLQIYQNLEYQTWGRWGGVCDDNFSTAVGNVVCEELGFSSINTWGGGYHGAWGTPGYYAGDSGGHFNLTTDGSCTGDKLATCAGGWGLAEVTDYDVTNSNASMFWTKGGSTRTCKMKYEYTWIKCNP